MLKLVFVFAVSVLFVACGGSPNKLGPAKNPAKNPAKEGAGTCPSELLTSYHRLVLHFSKPLPAKIGLKLDIDKEVRFSECANLRQTPPVATLKRVAGTNKLEVQVDHFGFYSPLPRDVSFDLLDLENCGASMQLFHSLKAQPLFWKLEYPNGPSCAGHAVSVVEILSAE
jgi:hypothetical protein